MTTIIIALGLLAVAIVVALLCKVPANPQTEAEDKARDEAEAEDDKMQSEFEADFDPICGIRPSLPYGFLRTNRDGSEL